jgi:hypothetical protein
MSSGVSVGCRLWYQRQHLRGAAFGAAQHRQVVVFDVAHVGFEDLAKAVDQPVGAVFALPQGHGAVLFQAHGQAVGPDAAHDGAAHPGHGLEGRAALLQVHAEEVAGQARRRVGANGGHAVARQVAFELDAADGKHRRAHQPRHPPPRRPAPASTNTVLATVFISRTSAGSGSAAALGQAGWADGVAGHGALSAGQARAESRLACCSRCRHSAS